MRANGSGCARAKMHTFLKVVLRFGDSLPPFLTISTLSFMTLSERIDIGAFVCFCFELVFGKKKKKVCGDCFAVCEGHLVTINSNDF